MKEVFALYFEKSVKLGTFLRVFIAIIFALTIRRR